MVLCKADLHIHTVLSPCADLEMSPVNIVRKAHEADLKLIGITDHNTTLHCELVRTIARTFGIMVLMGAEITTKEEIHCLAFFETTDQLKEMQDFLDQRLSVIPNDPLKFGYQVVVNENDEILFTEDRLLTAALDASINTVEEKVHELDGIFIPAHIDRNRFSIISQLGFIPNDLKAEAFEVSSLKATSLLDTFQSLNGPVSILRNSDAHYLHQIGSCPMALEMEQISFQEFRATLRSPLKIAI